MTVAAVIVAGGSGLAPIEAMLSRLLSLRQADPTPVYLYVGARTRRDLYHQNTLRDWIAENTSGVIFLSIRDSPKIRETHPSTGKTIVDELTQPISSVYNNFENFQDINSDLLIGNASAWFNNKIDRIDIQYQAIDYLPILQKMDSIRQNSARASLSWRLTTREKKGVYSNLFSPANQAEITRLIDLLN